MTRVVTFYKTQISGDPVWIVHREFIENVFYLKSDDFRPILARRDRDWLVFDATYYSRLPEICLSRTPDIKSEIVIERGYSSPPILENYGTGRRDVADLALGKLKLTTAQNVKFARITTSVEDIGLKITGFILIAIFFAIMILTIWFGLQSDCVSSEYAGRGLECLD